MEEARRVAFGSGERRKVSDFLFDFVELVSCFQKSEQQHSCDLSSHT